MVPVVRRATPTGRKPHLAQKKRAGRTEHKSHKQHPKHGGVPPAFSRIRPSPPQGVPARFRTRKRSTPRQCKPRADEKGNPCRFRPRTAKGNAGAGILPEGKNIEEYWEGCRRMTRVLIVDDNRLVRDMLKRHITTNQEVEVVEAGDGMRAVELVRAKAPDMILMDLMMPGMDGIEAIRRIREDPRNAAIPIIFLSSETDRGRWVEAFEAGANDFVQKPYEKRELLARMGTHLKLAGLTRELRVKNALLEREQYLAGHVQSQLLPRKLDFAGFDISAVYQAQEQIGGDFYDAWEDGDTVNIVMADICGHGASAALLMAVCKGLLYSLAKTLASPGDMVAEMNRMLYAMLDGGDLDMYVTLAFASANRATNTLDFLSAGHAPAYLLGESVAALGPTGPALGFHREFAWDTVTMPFVPGQAIFLLTDGVIELRAPDGEFFGETRLAALLSKDLPPRELIGTIIDKALPFCKGRITDDLAMLAARRTA